MALLHVSRLLPEQNTLLLVCISTAVLAAVFVARNIRAGGLARVPGPFLRSMTVLPRLWSVYLGNSHLDDLKLHQKYGGIVRLAPRIVSISDISHLDLIYGISSKFYKGGFYETARFYDEEGLIPDPFVLSDKPTHSRMKRNAANAYSLNALVQLEPLVDQVLGRLCAHLRREYASTGRVCDIGQYVHFFSMDAIFTVTYGKDLDFIQNGDNKGYCKHLQDGLPYMATCGQVPWAIKPLRTMGEIVSWVRGSGRGPSLFEEILDIAITQRAESEKRADETRDENAPATFLTILTRNKLQSPLTINDREINTHTLGNIFAGGDTTSTAARAIIGNLIDYPAVATRLLNDLYAAGLSTNAIVPYHMASKVPLLTAVIRESLRLHPSVGLILARAVPPEGAVLTDSQGTSYHLDSSVEIGMNPWVMHRDPAVFADPERFLPDRWLTATAEEHTRMMRSWMPFGVGRHKCSGQNISMMELYKLIPTLLLYFSMEWEHEDPHITVTNHFFTIQKGLRVRLYDRVQNDA